MSPRHSPSAESAPRAWCTPEEARSATLRGTGRGVRVAVIDSGVDATHPRLRDMTLIDRVAVVESGEDIDLIENEGEDVYGHGTAVAGILHEVAPEAEIGSFRVLDARNLSRTAVIRAGVHAALARGYHILNCSFGCRGLPKFILPHKEWIDEAYLRGVHVVAACNNRDPREPEWPAHFTSVIGVGVGVGADTGGDKQRAEAPPPSDEAETSDPLASLRHLPGQHIEYEAPGENQQVCWLNGEMRIETGSSFAAPRVSALLARLLSEIPELPPPHVHDLLPRIAGLSHRTAENPHLS